MILLKIVALTGRLNDMIYNSCNGPEMRRFTDLMFEFYGINFDDRK